jgi:hypothetical protein
VKTGLLGRMTQKGYSGGAIGQDIFWQTTEVLHRLYDRVRQIISNAATHHDGVCDVVRLLVGDDGLVIVAQNEGLNP